MRKEPKTGRMSARLTKTCRGLMNAIAAKLGISDAAVIEIAVREYAEPHGIELLHWDEEEG